MAFRHLPIKQKLIVITMVTSGIVLLLSSAAFLTYDLMSFRRLMGQNLLVQAEMIMPRSTAALVSNDSEAATESLSALKAIRNIAGAAIYRTDGERLASYSRENSSAAQFPHRPEGDGYRFDKDHIDAFRALRANGETVGILYLRSDLQRWYARMKLYSVLLLIFFLGSAPLAFLLSAKLQKIISEPILRLEQAMKTISSRKDYQLSVSKTSNDEIGRLIDGFNAMLVEIQQRKTALVGANQELSLRTRELESEIAERKRAQENLKTLNETLEQRVAERAAAAEQRSQDLSRSEEALRNQTRILQSILDSMADGVVVADETGKVMLWNPAAKQILRTNQLDAPLENRSEHFGFYHPGWENPYPANELPLMRAIRGEAVDSAELLMRSQEKGADIWLSVNARPLKDGEGGLRKAVAVFRDVTEQKRSQEDLVRAKDVAEEANRAKSAFLANMSHELRTPLNAIIGYSEMLQEEMQELDQAGCVVDLQRINSAGKHLLALINDILDLSKIEAGKMELDLEFFDVRSIISDAVTTIQPMVESNGNRIELDCPDNLGVMRADATKLRQVLFNLLSNACKFTEKGVVRLSALRQSADGKDWVRFCVSDTGIGIAPEQVGRLFQEFVQADPSTTRKYGGTGLGLAISKRFCEMLGGEITVDSREGEGSTFTVRLPAEVVTPTALEPQEQAVPVSESVPAETPASSNTVLVIDDDPTVHDLITRFLAKQGIGTAIAFTGEEGLRSAKQLRPMAITLDVLMRGMDGLEVLAALKADPATADIPVILITISDCKSKAYALGAAHYLSKPIDLAYLSSILKRFRTESSPNRVLVVDDDPLMRDLLGRMLAKEGWSVVVAENGHTALKTLAKGKPSVILLDLMMPEMDGFQFTTELRRREDCQDIPIIVITAKDVTEEDRRRLNGHIQKVLQKGSYSYDDLLREVTSVIRSCVSQKATALEKRGNV